MLSRRNFLLAASATAAVTVAKANAPLQVLETLTDTEPSWVPEGFILPRGQTLSRLMYPDLYAMLGKTYGGGPTTFKLPDLRPRVAASPVPSHLEGGPSAFIHSIMAVKSAGHLPVGSVVPYFVPAAA